MFYAMNVFACMEVIIPILPFITTGDDLPLIIADTSPESPSIADLTPTFPPTNDVVPPDSTDLANHFMETSTAYSMEDDQHSGQRLEHNHTVELARRTGSTAKITENNNELRGKIVKEIRKPGRSECGPGDEMGELLMVGPFVTNNLVK